MEILARAVMRTPPETILESASVWSALALMRERDIRHLLVVRGTTLVGVLSNRDYRRILERTRPDGSIQGIHDIVVAEIMTPVKRVVTAPPEMPLRDVARLIVERKVGCVPVLEGDEPRGILTQKDVIAALLNFRL